MQYGVALGPQQGKNVFTLKTLPAIDEMESEGRNKLKPLNVIYNLHIGPEIADVNLQPFTTNFDYLNPVKWGYYKISQWKNATAGVHIDPATNPTLESVSYHTPILYGVS